MDVYLKPNKVVYTTNGNQLKLKDLAQIVSEATIQQDIENITVLQADFKYQDFNLLSSIELIKSVKNYDNSLRVNIIGNTDIIIKERDDTNKSLFTYFKLLFITILVFLGSGYTIMYFHSDVNMYDMQKKLCEMVTGDSTNLLMLQIPYSIGIGLGLTFFFNRLRSKKVKGEPSPLELELYLYSDNVDKYIKDNS